VIQVEAGPVKVEGAALEREVDEDLEEYDRWQQENLKNTRAGQQMSMPLSPYERAAIKTYLAYKLGIGPNNSAA